MYDLLGRLKLYVFILKAKAFSYIFYFFIHAAQLSRFNLKQSSSLCNKYFYFFLTNRNGSCSTQNQYFNV